MISGAMRVLSRDIKSDDGVANAALREAAARLDEQEHRINELQIAIHETIEENLHLADGDNCTLIKLKQVA